MPLTLILKRYLGAYVEEPTYWTYRIGSFGNVRTFISQIIHTTENRQLSRAVGQASVVYQRCSICEHAWAIVLDRSLDLDTTFIMKSLFS